MVRFSVMLLVVLTFFILVLPVMLPPLPPPPLMLLLVPVFIMALLFLLAFSPSKVPTLAVVAACFEWYLEYDSMTRLTVSPLEGSGLLKKKDHKSSPFKELQEGKYLMV
ncbi:protein ORGAN SIZE RELATED 1-like [Abrus precatorius]|uniref:Protein ORGAN SIZE RELATED 1-like n=1 Tax=Abrus precatorius TaxID=3816 RepID=A0A8B8K5B2_ABRPR|nr:protein ORGAN SIZE RELATED 1-like [Abrus precatorius]